MKKIKLISAILLAIPLIVFGSNDFFHFFSLPPGDGSLGSDLLQLMRDGGLMKFVALCHVIFGVLLLIPRFRTLAAILQLPITLGILFFHIAMLPAGVAMAAIMLVLNILAAFDSDKMKALLK